MKMNLIAACFATLALSSCASMTDLGKMRNAYTSSEVKDKIQQNTEGRVQVMRNMDTKTLYSDKIQCLGKYIAQHNSRIIDRSYINQYAVNRDDEQASKLALEQAEQKVNAEKEKLRLLKIAFHEKNEKVTNLRHLTNVNSKKLTQKEIKQLAVDVVELEEMRQEIVKLTALIESAEKEVLALRSNLNSKSLDFQRNVANFRQGGNFTSYAVSKIYDKTEKIYSQNSTALSELVAHALSYNPAIKYKDSPFHSGWYDSQTRIVNTNQQSSIGSLINADRYISGALVQYDEGLPISHKDLNGFRVSVDPVGFDKRTKVITVGLVLRSVGSKNGEMLLRGFNRVKPISANDNKLINVQFDDFESVNASSVFVQNTFLVKQIGVNAFEIVSKRNYGGSVSIETSDPKTYAVREMVEKAVYDLLLKSLPEKEYVESLGKEIHSGLYSAAKAECGE